VSKQVPFEIFADVPLFQGLNETECRQFAEIARYQEFAPGEEIISQGQVSQDLWILLEGKCDVIKIGKVGKRSSQPIVLAELEPHSHFGEMSFFNSAPHSASVTAQTHVKLLKIARGDYEELIQEGCRAAYKVAYNTVQCLAERLRKMDDWVAELSAKEPQANLPKMKGATDGKPHEWSVFRDKMLRSCNL
jgi:CRP-like cAMP-binding protein